MLAGDLKFLMITHLILFDMDGVLLNAQGYHKSLQRSVEMAGHALGVPNTKISEDQIAKFEALNVTNEWDSIAICAALILLHVWNDDPAIRLDRTFHNIEPVSSSPIDFGYFLDTFHLKDDLPGRSALDWIFDHRSDLNTSQKEHLIDLLENCRDIQTSITLAIHQETVLGSDVFHMTYGLESQLNIQSYLSKFDKPLLNASSHQGLLNWLSSKNHNAGILTNRPSLTPSPLWGSPEAELGAERAGLDHLPILGSGMLSWFAATHCGLPGHTFLKPNPVHALALMQMCLSESSERALQLASQVWFGKARQDEWLKFSQCKVIVFEDSVKGLICAKSAQQLLNLIGIDIELHLIGVGKNPIKATMFAGLADKIIKDINEIDYDRLE